MRVSSAPGTTVTTTAWSEDFLNAATASEALSDKLGASAVGEAVFTAVSESAALTAIGLSARPPAVSTLTSAQTVTNAQDLGDGFVICDDGTNNNSNRAYYTAGTNIAVKCVMSWDANTNNHQAGLVMRDNAGKYVTFYVYMNGSGTLSFVTAKWSSHSGYVGNYTSTAIAASINARLAAAIATGVPFYLRIRTPAASWIAEWSMNGATWTQFDTQTSTDYLAAINFVGVAVNPGSAAQALALEVQSWAVS